jgi:hypothetical protein
MIGKPIGIVMLLLASLSCGADPDTEEAPGACSLNCSGAKIGSNDMRIRFLSPPALSWRCGIRASYSGAVCCGKTLPNSPSRSS